MKKNMTLRTRDHLHLTAAVALAICANLAPAFAAWSIMPPEKYPSQNATRVDAIAAMLPEKPSSPAPRPSDRTAWAALSNDPGAARIVAEAESLCGKPIPDLPDVL